MVYGGGVDEGGVGLIAPSRSRSGRGRGARGGGEPETGGGGSRSSGAGTRESGVIDLDPGESGEGVERVGGEWGCGGGLGFGQGVYREWGGPVGSVGWALAQLARGRGVVSFSL